MLRESRDVPLEGVTPEQAIEFTANILNQIRQQHGPRAIAFYLSGQLTTESQYLFNKFGKGLLGTNHVDSNSRLCMSSAASGYTLSLGSDGPPTSYSDIELADTFFLIGSNAADCHPVTFTRVRRQIENACGQCIVVDTRRTSTADAATIYLPIRPGTDLDAMGGRDVGYMSHLLPGQRKITDDVHRASMEQFWQLPPGSIHPQAGYDAVAMFDALHRGEIKAIWIVGTNPAGSMPNLKHIRCALEMAELVIVQDAYTPTETTGFADVILPAAVHLEQSGTFCNSERRVTLMEQAIAPPGDAKPDWWWAKQIAAKMGFTHGMLFDSSADIFDEFAASIAGRPNDQSGLSHAVLQT